MFDRSRALLTRLIQRIRLTELTQRHDPTQMLALFNLINGSVSIGLLSVVAYLTHSPFIFPSLGPTAFLLYHQPTAAASCPRNTVIGHFIGATVGWICLGIFGLLDEPAAMIAGMTRARVGAAALSLGGTSALMILLKAAHPPAGATTLIVSLGLMPHLWQIPVLMGAVLLLTGQAFVINRLAGIRYPYWRPHESRGEKPKDR